MYILLNLYCIEVTSCWQLVLLIEMDTCLIIGATTLWSDVLRAIFSLLIKSRWLCSEAEPVNQGEGGKGGQGRSGRERKEINLNFCPASYICLHTAITLSVLNGRKQKLAPFQFINIPCLLSPSSKPGLCEFQAGTSNVIQTQYQQPNHVESVVCMCLNNWYEKDTFSQGVYVTQPRPVFEGCS